MTAQALLLGLAIVLFSASPTRADPAGDPALTDAPPPVPLGIIEGSAAPVAPVSPRRVRRAPTARAQAVKTEKPMDRWARIPRPQSRAGTASAFPLSNGNGYGGGASYHGVASGCR